MNFVRRTVKKFHHRVVAQVKIVSAPQVNHSRQRYDSVQRGFMSGQAQCELPARGMSHHHQPARIDAVSVCVLQQELMGVANVSKASRPAAAVIPDAPVFDICGCNSTRL